MRLLQSTPHKHFKQWTHEIGLVLEKAASHKRPQDLTHQFLICILFQIIYIYLYIIILISQEEEEDEDEDEYTMYIYVYIYTQ